MAYHPFPFLWEVYTTKKKNPMENKPTQWSFLREPTKDIDFTGSVTEGCFRKGAQCPWLTSLAETSKDLEIILITIVLSFSNSLSRTSLYFSLKTSFVYSNLFNTLLHSNEQTCTLTLKRVQEGARNCLKLQSINYFTIAACGNVIEFHSVLLFIDPSRLILMDSVICLSIASPW